MTIITDPLFYAFAVPAVVFLGLSKGGFSGIGMVATPLLALIMPPLEAAALLLPILLVQDAFSAWVYRRVWDPWNLKVLLPGAVIGVGAAWLLAAHVPESAVRLLVGLIALGFVMYAFLSLGRPDILLVDLRENSERAKHGTISGALHAPYPSIGENLQPGGMLREVAAATGRRVVFFCAFGERSAMAVAAAKNAGLANTAHIEGGIDAWKKVGGPVAMG